MDLPRLSPTFDLAKLINTLFEWKRTLEGEDKKNRKQAANLEISSGQSLILTDTVTGARVSLSVASGVVTVTTL